jgi:uncharacterized protein YjdB
MGGAGMGGAGMGGAGMGGAGGTMVTATLTSIAVTPAMPTLAMGATQQLSATGTYSDGSNKDLTAMVTWTSGTAANATVSTGGLVTGVAKGTSMITAAMGTIMGSTTVTVTQPPAIVSIALTPTSPTIAKGTTQQFTATATFDDGTTKDISATATWASDTAAAATVSATGLATGVDAGMAMISATSGGKTGSTTLTVKVANLVSIAVTPGPTTTIATGTMQQFTATGTFMDPITNAMTTQDLTTKVTWASSATASATITAAGLATATTTPGMTTISATSGTIQGVSTLTVTKAALMTITVSTATPSIPKGTTATFKAVGTFADMTTQDLTTQVAWSSGTPGFATVVATTGVATGVAAGTSAISAKLGTITGMANLTVTPAVVTSISVTLEKPVATGPDQLAVRTTGQLVATGVYSDSATPVDITSLVTWSSSSTAAIAVSNAAATKGLATAGTAAGMSTITAQVGMGATAVTGTLIVHVVNETLLSILVQPSLQTIAAGFTFQFTAVGFFSDSSQQFVTETATWSSGTAGVATVSNVAGTKGLAQGVAAGTAPVVITAAIGAVNDTAALTVTTAVLQSITIDPPAPSIALGTTVTLTATGLFSDKSKQDITTTVTWKSATPAVATVSAAGKVSPVTKGTSDITATFVVAANQTVTATATVTVTDASLKTISIDGATPIEKGTTTQLKATGTYTDTNTQDLTKTVTWTSDKPTIASVSNTAGSIGLVTGTGTGTAVITATSSAATGSVKGTFTILVNDGNLVSIAVTPAAPTIAPGTKLQMHAIGTFDDGAQQEITTGIAWATDTVGAATVDDAGLVTAVATGMAKITATSGTGTTAIAGSTTVKVSMAKLSAIAISPEPTVTSLPKGTTVQFKATGSFNDGTTQDLTDTATWISSNGNVTISNDPASNGLAKGAVVGNSNITASVVIGTTTTTSLPTMVTVTAATLMTFTISPNPASVPNGATAQLTATGVFSDGTMQNLSNSSTWGSAATATATVSTGANPRGVVTGHALGMVVITATSSVATGSKPATVMLTVGAAVVKSIAVTPAPTTVVKGMTRQFTAQATMTDNTKMDISATATWASDATGTATVSGTGLATGVAVGTAHITAMSGGVSSNNATLTVTN